MQGKGCKLAPGNCITNMYTICVEVRWLAGITLYGSNAMGQADQETSGCAEDGRSAALESEVHSDVCDLCRKS